MKQKQKSNHKTQKAKTAQKHKTQTHKKVVFLLQKCKNSKSKQPHYSNRTKNIYIINEK